MTMWMALGSAALTIVAVVVVMRGALSRTDTTLAVTAAVVSVIVTVGIAAGRPPGEGSPEWGASLLPSLIELAALMALTVRFAHRGRTESALLGAGAASLAIALLVLRLTSPASWPATVGAGGLWGLGAAVAAAVGLHLRRQDQRRERYAAEARRAQRLRLARDLHDFVAHDVSEMVAGAQAGQVVGADPAHAVALFRRIEQAGQHALATLDRTVHMLETQASTPGSGLEDVPALVARFDATGPVRARLTFDPTLTDSVPVAVAALAYRIVAEALTNVRRHAATATLVSVDVTRTGLSTLALTVTNDLSATAEQASRGVPAGRGLAGLAAAAGAVGGRVDAGRHDAGWRLSAQLPLTSARARETQCDDVTCRT
ncbi:hypothetical protein Dsi01nite_060330 [Dactylosporangium siamense]|uniref:histidine kinase n=1 Tax=Dactylosporangium siamense TaxID=685454 RepID=A0A919PPR9_9ACTN|nr:hypothetical protein Dsi01nite_060330 [Dactylosporangium siamense]